MKLFKSAACCIIAIFCLFLFVQPGIGAEVAESGGITGTWKGKGIDTRGVTWEITFNFTQKDGVIEGTSTWEGSDGSSATSSIKGTINFAKKSFKMQDVNLENVSGDVMIGLYTGTFSADFMKMTGKWTIPQGGSPGTFEVVKEKE